MFRSLKTKECSLGNMIPRTIVCKEYDSDDDYEKGPAPPSLKSGHLSWRMPPEESYSDWTIEIVDDSKRNNTKETKDDKAHKEISRIYHVHKVTLAVGPKKSLYFERLFRYMSTNATISTKTKTSRIKLHAAAARAMPCFLD